MELPPISPRTTAPEARPGPDPDAAARAAALDFEAAFLAEMLKHSGVNEMPSTFGGGAGEDAFASLLTDEYARLITERGGIGLAEQVFEILKQGTPGQ